jgi:1,4-dihydroxy-6-naphthoate synthase
LKQPITLAHSPDPDDAFMWWPLADIDGSGPSIDVGEFEFELVMKDIETLNLEAEQGSYDITAISIAHYPTVAHVYDLTACGASLGDGYGPKVVAKKSITMDDLLASNPKIAVPGLRTSALATLRILAGKRSITWEPVPFTEIMDVVSAGDFDAGVVIHEGQLTYEEHGLFEVCDLGAWWKDTTSMPLPLGGNAIKKDIDSRLEEGSIHKITSLLLESIEYAMAHREKSLSWANQWGRGIDMACTDEFVEMYVNKWTLDFGDTGKKAVQRFLNDAAQVGAVAEISKVEFV